MGPGISYQRLKENSVPRERRSFDKADVALLSDYLSRKNADSVLVSRLAVFLPPFFPFYIVLVDILRRRRHDARHPRDYGESLDEREREREVSRVEVNRDVTLGTLKNFGARNEGVSPNDDDDTTLPLFVPPCYHDHRARRPLGSLRYPILDESGQHNLLETR